MSVLGNTAGVFAEALIGNLVNVVALMGMYRATGNEEYRQTAAGWLDRLDQNMASLRRELTREYDK